MCKHVTQHWHFRLPLMLACIIMNNNGGRELATVADKRQTVLWKSAGMSDI